MISHRLVRVRRLLWRWRWGWCPESVLADALQQEMGFLSTRIGERRGWNPHLRRRHGERFRRREEALDAVLRHLGSGRFEDAFNHLCRAESEAEGLARLICVHEEHGDSVARWQELVPCLGLEAFVELFTLAVVPRLHQEVDELLTTGDARKARFVLGVAEATMDTFERTWTDPAWSQRLQERLERMTFGEPYDSRLRELLAAGRHTLVGGLMDDLEIRAEQASKVAASEIADLAGSLKSTAQRSERLLGHLRRQTS